MPSTNPIKLRAIEDSDLTALHDLLNNPSNQTAVGGSVRPLSYQETCQWLDNKRKDPDTYCFAIYDNNHAFFGYVQLTAIRQADGTAILGINLSPTSTGRGIGTQALNALHYFAKQYLNLRKLSLYVRSDNIAAIGLYRKTGYHPVGVLTQHIKTTNGYIDLQIWEYFL